MSIQYSRPLSEGFTRMKKALFQPFKIEKWFAIGFTAFLATLSDCQGNSGSKFSNNNSRDFDWDELFRFPETARNWLFEHPLYFNLIIAGIVFLFIIFVVFTWLSSRGKFMFLHNVVFDKAEIKKPWFEFRKEGNSLFFWKLVYGLICLAVFITFFISVFNTGKKIYYEDLFELNKFWAIFKLIFIFIGLIILTGYINTFLNHFVVPIMYKKRTSALKGWGRFLKLFGRHGGHFILYGLFVFILGIAVVIGIVIACIMTCCLGFLLLILPYISTVITLPIHYTFRAFSVEYLEQFGEEFKLFPENEVNTETTG